MTRPIWLALLLAVPLIGFCGCTPETNALSPRAEDNPELYRLASLEMESVAIRNKKAEAGFFRKLRATPPVISDAKENTSQRKNDTADIKEKP